MSRNEDFEDHAIFHKTKPESTLKRLEGFYGRVAQRQNKLIISKILGKKVIDIGSGYGFLLKHLKECDFEATGIEPAPKEFHYSKKWWGVSVIEDSVYNLSEHVNLKNTNTLILRDVIFHLDTQKVLKEIENLNHQRIIVFMGNTGFLLYFVKWVLGHREHDMKKTKDYISIFEKYNYNCTEREYTDFIAFPLSGGFISLNIIPEVKWIQRLIINIEDLFERLVRFLGLDKFIAFRVLLVFDRVSK